MKKPGWLLLSFFFLICSVELNAQRSALKEASRRNALLRLLRERKIPFEERSLFAEYGGFSSSLHIVIPRSREPPAPGLIDTLVIGIPLFSGRERFSEDSALPFSFEAGIAFIEGIRESGSSLDIRVAFLGDEASNLPRDFRKSPHKGLADLYEVLDEPESSILLYLDIPETPQSLRIHHGAERSLTALEVLEPFYRSCKSRNTPVSLAVWFNELYKLSLVQGQQVMRFARDWGINALCITGSAQTDTALPAVSAEALAGTLMDYAGSLAVSRDNLDYHFLILRIFGTYFFISESVTVQIFLLVAGLLFLGSLLYITIRRSTVLQEWRLYIPYLWIFPVFLVSLVLTLEISGALIAAVSSEFTESPLSNDFGWAVFKIIIAVILLSLQFSFWNRLNVPKKADFYGTGAVILVALGVFIAVFLDITFIPVFTGIFLFVLLGAVIPFPLPVYGCALVAPLMSFGPLFNLFAVHGGTPLFSAGKLTEIILSKNILSSLYIATLTLPFILLLERGAALLKTSSRTEISRRRFLPVLAILGLMCAALSLYARRLREIPFETPVRRVLEGSEDTLRITLDQVTFLERRNIHIDLDAPGRPLSFNLYLDTADGSPPVIYAASMPFAFIDDQRSAAFTLGEGPPNPFSTDIVLPVSFSGFLRVEAVYAEWDPAVDTLPQPESGDYILCVTRKVKI
ncbi:MAG: hypothetical protein LBG87_00485 [Spirochaetaceae bacterium]|jgi:hypothetical protein|nr:hypothetical protein [Spirochaetaceae bacterium]